MLEQQLVNALSLGCVYALFALGFTLIFGVLGVINLSHGAVFMVGAYAAVQAMARFDLPLWAGLLFAFVFCGLFGLLIDFLVLQAAARAQRAAPDPDDRHHRRRDHPEQRRAGHLRRRERALPGRHDVRTNRWTSRASTSRRWNSASSWCPSC